MSAASRNRIQRAAKHQVVTTIGHDVLVGGITMAAILLLVGTGTTWLRTLMGFADMVGASQPAIIATLLLNISLILFGWRRYVELRAEVDRRAEAEAQALILARFDSLTGFLNRRALDELGNAAIAQWRAAGLDIAVLAIDIDAFKSINDLFGHSGGDTLLQETANRIRRAAPSDALLARLGGDEFAALLPLPKNDHQTFDILGQNLIERLSEQVLLDSIPASTSCSIGGVIARDQDIILEMLLRHADSAMYRAKRNGRCRFSLFDHTMEQALAKRDLIERELRLAMASDELYPVYEPLIDLSTDEPVGYEMLARWTSPVLGEVPPADFIPVAEEKGLISALSDMLFRRAFQEAGQWPAHISLSINVSPLQLRDPWFAQKLLKLLAETGYPAQRLILELTESAIVDNLPLAQAVFTSLRNQGIRMALDDFGTGYSSIASLRSLPFDSVKIDREFVARMSQHESEDSIAEAVLQLGKSLGLPVVAEGIECKETARRLSDLSCAVGQGHFYGAALTGSAVLQRFAPKAAVAAPAESTDTARAHHRSA